MRVTHLYISQAHIFFAFELSFFPQQQQMHLVTITNDQHLTHTITYFIYSLCDILTATDKGLSISQLIFLS